ncbi:MAG TPA: hypothetical protein VFT29_07180 [Gemmatimonadaceae bacterium]|nr:hypothetical protein [Gemmatimonadaceae bacterium]
MTKAAVVAVVGLCALCACSDGPEPGENAETAGYLPFDTTQTVVAIPISEAVPASQLAALDSARIADSLAAKAKRDSVRAKQARDSARKVAERAIENRRYYGSGSSRQDP